MNEKNFECTIDWRTLLKGLRFDGIVEKNTKANNWIQLAQNKTGVDTCHCCMWMLNVPVHVEALRARTKWRLLRLWPPGEGFDRKLD